MNRNSDRDLVEDMVLADRIKASAPESSVSADAIFLELRRIGRTVKVRSSWLYSGDPPEIFNEALLRMKGRKLTIGEFILFAGMLPADKAKKNAVGAWLRQSGRLPRKSGGRVIFDI